MKITWENIHYLILLVLAANFLLLFLFCGPTKRAKTEEISNNPTPMYFLKEPAINEIKSTNLSKEVGVTNLIEEGNKAIQARESNEVPKVNINKATPISLQSEETEAEDEDESEEGKLLPYKNLEEEKEALRDDIADLKLKQETEKKTTKAEKKKSKAKKRKSSKAKETNKDEKIKVIDEDKKETKENKEDTDLPEKEKKEDKEDTDLPEKEKKEEKETKTEEKEKPTTPEETKPVDVKPENTTEVKPHEHHHTPTTNETKPEEVVPAPVEPIQNETKPEEVKPVEPIQNETKTEEVSPAPVEPPKTEEVKPVEPIQNSTVNSNEPVTEKEPIVPSENKPEDIKNDEVSIVSPTPLPMPTKKEQPVNPSNTTDNKTVVGDIAEEIGKNYGDKKNPLPVVGGNTISLLDISEIKQLPPQNPIPVESKGKTIIFLIGLLIFILFITSYLEKKYGGFNKFNLKNEITHGDEEYLLLDEE
ncbi:MAG: hypothetical protein MJ252_11575 [archaeon]|nr:hypothetical protein [archaeon]